MGDVALGVKSASGMHHLRCFRVKILQVPSSLMYDFILCIYMYVCMHAFIQLQTIYMLLYVCMYVCIKYMYVCMYAGKLLKRFQPLLQPPLAPPSAPPISLGFSFIHIGTSQSPSPSARRHFSQAACRTD
jgi:hypothetical protein